MRLTRDTHWKYFTVAKSHSDCLGLGAHLATLTNYVKLGKLLGLSEPVS